VKGSFPEGSDRQKSKRSDKDRSRFPAGNDRQKGKCKSTCNGNGRCRSLAALGMTNIGGLVGTRICGLKEEDKRVGGVVAPEFGLRRDWLAGWVNSPFPAGLRWFCR